MLLPLQLFDFLRPSGMIDDGKSYECFAMIMIRYDSALAFCGPGHSDFSVSTGTSQGNDSSTDGRLDPIGRRFDFLRAGSSDLVVLRFLFEQKRDYA